MAEPEGEMPKRYIAVIAELYDDKTIRMHNYIEGIDEKTSLTTALQMGNAIHLLVCDMMNKLSGNSPISREEWEKKEKDDPRKWWEFGTNG